MDHPILFFSTFCNYCEQFVAALDNNGLSNVFKYINIDVDPETGSRPSIFYDIQSKLQLNITEVPTIVLKEGEYVLAGEEAFKWLQFQLENKNNVVPPEPKELNPYNPMEMGSFSDPYASVNSESLHDAKNQSFKFLNAADERIMTPVEERLQKQQSHSASPKRPVSSNPPTPQFKHAPKPEIDFTSNRFGYASQNLSETNNNNIDARLQQLLAEREATVPPPPHRE